MPLGFRECRAGAPGPGPDPVCCTSRQFRRRCARADRRRRTAPLAPNGSGPPSRSARRSRLIRTTWRVAFRRRRREASPALERDPHRLRDSRASRRSGLPMVRPRDGPAACPRICTPYRSKFPPRGSCWSTPAASTPGHGADRLAGSVPRTPRPARHRCSVDRWSAPQRQQVLRVEARIDREQPLEAPHQQSGADQQHDGERHLAAHENRARQALGPVPGVRPPGRSAVKRSGRAVANAGHQPENQTGQERDPHRKPQDARRRFRWPAAGADWRAQAP